ncbi:RcnB family protein [Phenylobacterium sp.]|uniref:RcnB family protein n=1 Tax=Phenylobacterium sp. TaxID=1871053 RepID=UPI002B893397|nr:RcnB family protein [Phenylobacterium sp.]HVI33926.1 RcnB family protein [Phenylobacterium sp.]
MKKALLIAAAAAMTFAGAAASAQPYGYGGYDGYGRYERDSDRDGRPDRREWNRDRDRDGRPDQYDRYDNRRGHAYGHRSNRWRTGQRYPYYNNRGYYISDYHRYRLPPPRPGYRYYRSDNGDIVMAAIATGIIGLIIADALNDNDHRDYRYDRYDRYDRRW